MDNKILPHAEFLEEAVKTIAKYKPRGITILLMLDENAVLTMHENVDPCDLDIFAGSLTYDAIQARIMANKDVYRTIFKEDEENDNGE